MAVVDGADEGRCTEESGCGRSDGDKDVVVLLLGVEECPWLEVNECGRARWNWEVGWLR